MNFLYAIIFLIVLPSCVAKQKVIHFDITKEQWVEDLEFLNNLILSKHKSPFHFKSKNEIKLKLSSSIISINDPGMHKQDRALILSEFAAQFGDGHTYINPYKNFDRFPIFMQWFQDKLIITAIDKVLEKYQGWQIVKIGNYEIFEALGLIGKFIPQNESKNFIKIRSEFLFCLKDVLKHSGLLTAKDELKLTVKNMTNDVESFLVQLKDFDVNKTITSEFRADLPLRFKPNSQTIYSTINSSKVGYFNFKTYPSRFDVKNIGRGLNDWILKENIQSLIIDFRLNGGGDFTIGRAILKEIKRSILTSKIKIFIAIGKYTYSAGMSNASDFKNELDGIYIGQTTGAKANGYQESYEFFLPNSNIQGSTSIEYYEFSKKNTAGIEPDIKINYNWNDYYNGIDPLIDYLINSEIIDRK